jgi:6-phosphofructokinase 2
MAQILTITMNPAIDISTSAERVMPIAKLRCTAVRRDPGGGGINVARVASRLGAAATALYPMGGHVGQLLQRLVDAEQLRSLSIPVEEETREDFTVLETTTGKQFRFVLPGPPLQNKEWQSCLDAVASCTPKPDFLVASGSLPRGVPDDFYAQVAKIARRWDVPMALDTSGPALRAAMGPGVDLIKPNLGELRALVGGSLPDETSWFEACRELIAAGSARMVALTLGHRGALLVTVDAAWRAPPLPIEPVSTVGAGDGFLGAMVWALASGQSLEQAFRYGMAGASASLLAPGTGLGEAREIHKLVERVLLESVGVEAVGSVTA